MRPAELEAAALDRFRAALLRSPRARLERDQLWAAFARAFPVRPQGAEERQWFRAALDQAVADGTLRLPAQRGRGWDRSQTPAIPLKATLRREGATRRDDSWRTYPWHADLAWVADRRMLTAEQVGFLRRVHDGLRDGTFRQPAPLKYRSLQLTGDEKRLGSLTKTKLFGPGRLSLERLGCLPDRVPLAWASVGEDSSALVVENAGLFNVAVSVLRELSHPPYGIVVYGAGTGVEQSLPGLRDVGRPVTSVMYVGDLDRAGLRIAQAAAQASRKAGLPSLEPAPGLHKAMLDSAAHLDYPSGWPTQARRSRTDDAHLVSWLPTDVRIRVRELLGGGRRVPEEVLGPEELLQAWSKAR